MSIIHVVGIFLSDFDLKRRKGLRAGRKSRGPGSSDIPPSRAVLTLFPCALGRRFKVVHHDEM